MLTICPKRIVVLLLGSANRDETVFSQPDVLSLARRSNPHVSVGGGPHHWIGAVLARMEARQLLTGLIGRGARHRVDGATERRPSATFRAWHRMELALER